MKGTERIWRAVSTVAVLMLGVALMGAAISASNPSFIGNDITIKTIAITDQVNATTSATVNVDLDNAAWARVATVDSVAYKLRFALRCTSFGTADSVRAFVEFSEDGGTSWRTAYSAANTQTATKFIPTTGVIKDALYLTHLATDMRVSFKNLTASADTADMAFTITFPVDDKPWSD